MRRLARASSIGVANPTSSLGGPVDAALDTLATALYVTTDDLLKTAPHLAPWRPAVGITPKLSDAELVTLAVMQALLGFPSEARWLRDARAHLGHLFPYLPKQPGYNKRLRAAAALLQWSSGRWPATRRFGPTTCGWPTPPRWSAAARARPPSARSWPAGPSTATAPATRATFGGCGCTWSAPCTACRSASP